jgi:hypothetical protein
MSFNMKFISKRFSKERQRHNCDNDERRSRLTDIHSAEKDAEITTTRVGTMEIICVLFRRVEEGKYFTIILYHITISSLTTPGAPSLPRSLFAGSQFSTTEKSFFVLKRLGAENRV